MSAPVAVPTLSATDELELQLSSLRIGAANVVALEAVQAAESERLAESDAARTESPGGVASVAVAERETPCAAADIEPMCSSYPPMRSYQSRIVSNIAKLQAKHWAQHKASAPALPNPVAHSRVLVYLPTGGGKTRVAAELCRAALLTGQSAVFIVNRNKLATQAAEAMGAIGLRKCTAILKAGFEACLDKPLQITSIQSLCSESRHYPPAQLLIIDEAHCAVSDSFTALLAHYKACGTFVVGLTATPLRLDPTESLSHVFQSMLRGPSISELVLQRVVVPPVVHFVNAAEVRKSLKGKAVRLKAGQAEKEGASKSSLKELVCTAPMVSEAVRAWLRVCAGAKTIAFCVDIPHSEALACAFREAGVHASHIDGGTPDKEREKLFLAFDSGRLRVLTSVNVLCEGFDQPDIGAVMLLRPTKSKGLYLQMVGRGLRASAGKQQCIVLDQCGNTLVHGPVTGPAGYVPEPWGDDVTDGGSGCSKPKQKPALWRLRECGGGCGAVLHPAHLLCPTCTAAATDAVEKTAVFASHSGCAAREESDAGAARGAASLLTDPVEGSTAKPVGVRVRAVSAPKPSVPECSSRRVPLSDRTNQQCDSLAAAWADSALESADVLIPMKPRVKSTF